MFVKEHYVEKIQHEMRWKMSYETSEGKGIKTIAINVSHLQKTFDDYVKILNMNY